MKFSLGEVGRIVPLKYEILSFGKCPNYLIPGLQRVNFFELWQY